MALRFIPLFACCAALVSLPTEARACSPMLCVSPQFAPGAGGVVAADVPGIPLRLSQYLSQPKAPVELLDAAGKAQLIQVETDTVSGWNLLKPVKGLTPGAAYVLRMPDHCQALELPAPATPVLTLFPFTAGPPAPAPQTIGKLTLTALPTEVIQVWTYSGSCTVGLLVGSVQLSLQPSAELLPWLPVAQSETWVDGKLFSKSEPGHVPFAGGPPQPTGWPNEINHVDRIFAACGAVPQGVEPGLALGKHHLDFRIHLPGFNQPAYLSTDFELACQLPGADAGSSDGAAGDAGAADAGASVPPPAAPAKGGCSAGRSAGGWGWLLLLALGGVWRGRGGGWRWQA